MNGPRLLPDRTPAERHSGAGKVRPGAGDGQAASLRAQARGAAVHVRNSVRRPPVPSNLQRQGVRC